MPTDNDIFSTGILYITDNEGNKTELGEINTFDMSVDLAKQEDQTVIHTFKSFEGSFKIKNSSGLTRMITKCKNRNKYLKRVRNRQKLYNKLKKKGRKL